jgi:hypothetical protein
MTPSCSVLTELPQCRAVMMTSGAIAATSRMESRSAGPNARVRPQLLATIKSVVSDAAVSFRDVIEREPDRVDPLLAKGLDNDLAERGVVLVEIREDCSMPGHSECRPARVGRPARCKSSPLRLFGQRTVAH